MKPLTRSATRFASSLNLVLWIFLAKLCIASPQSEEDVDEEMKQALKAAITDAESFTDKFEAEVWLLQKATVLEKFVKDEKQRMHILKEVHKAAKKAEVPPEFVLAVIEVESHFNRFAISVVGAQGMMQVMPFWKKVIGRESDNLIDLKTNLKYGCAILKIYLDREKGQWATALARYNGSYGKYWYPEKVMNAWERHWR